MESTPQPRFKLIYVFWAMSLIAASLATFGVWGIGFAIGAFAFWFGVSLVVTGRSSCIEVGVVGGFLLIGSQLLLAPAMRGSREAALRTQCINNVKQIGFGADQL